MQHFSKKINLGCGRNILSSWINLDKFALMGVDIIADLDDCKNTKFPFDNNEVPQRELIVEPLMK